MQVDLREARRADVSIRPARRGGGHRARPGQAEHLVRRGDAGAAEAAAQGRARKARSAPPCRSAVRVSIRRQHALAAPAAPARPSRHGAWPIFRIRRGDGGMQMEMLVGVDMIERQAGGGEGGELGFDLGFQLARAPWAGRTSPRRPAPCRCGNCRWHRPDRAPRRPAGPACLPPAPDAGRRASDGMALARAHRIGGGGAGHHQAGGGENAVAMGALDRVIDFAAAPKSSAVTMSVSLALALEACRQTPPAMEACLPRLTKRSCLRGCAGTGRTPRLRAGGAPACRAR